MADSKQTAPAKPDLDAMSLEEKVKWHYIHQSYSIQDIARTYRMSVDEVLAIIGQSALSTVTTQGDMIDQQEAGPGAQLQHEKQHHVEFSTD